jgi:hypothetical protein
MGCEAVKDENGCCVQRFVDIISSWPWHKFWNFQV